MKETTMTAAQSTCPLHGPDCQAWNEIQADFR